MIQNKRPQKKGYILEASVLRMQWGHSSLSEGTHATEERDKHVFPYNMLASLQLHEDRNGTQESTHPLPVQLLSTKNYLQEAWKEDTESEYELINIDYGY